MPTRVAYRNKKKLLPPISLPHGALSEIAREFRPPLTPQHVAEVASGRRTSRRVRAAVEAYAKTMPAAL